LQLSNKYVRRLAGNNIVVLVIRKEFFLGITLQTHTTVVSVFYVNDMAYIDKVSGLVGVEHHGRIRFLAALATIRTNLALCNRRTHKVKRK
jgi:uncharacterized membrane protein YhaH (DUF805 family)